MRIETERLVLREFRDEDWRAMAAYWRDPRYRRFRRDLDDVDRAVRDLVGRFVAGQAAQPRLIWQLAIAERGDQAAGRLIGSVGIRVDNPDRRQANIGYELAPPAWGRGYATEAARAILRFGFAELGMHRVWAECVVANTASSRVMEKLGMRREARFRELEWFHNRWWDGFVYAILDHEWRAAQPGEPPDANAAETGPSS